MSRTERGRGAAADIGLASSRLLDAGIAGGLWLLGVAVCLHYGRMGFMPFDQSIVWDAGWRLLGGQVPFRDFVTTTSLVPGALQAAVFAVAGVSWLTYCAHAAVVNGLFAVAAFALLRGEDLHPAPAAIFGAASAVFFYPPFGVPYADQHSFFFGLLALVFASMARRPTSRRGPLLMGLVPGLLVLGYLSKPVPAGFLLPAVAAVALWPGPDRRPPRTVALLTGAIVSVGVVAVVLAAMGAHLGLAWDYLVTLPLDTGGHRALNPGWLGDRVRTIMRLGRRSELAFPWAAAAASVVAAVGLVLLALRGGETARRARAAARPLATALLLWGGTVLFVGVTRNQARNGQALLPVVLGLLAASAVRVARAATVPSEERSWGMTGLRRFAVVAAGGLVLVALHDAVRFNATVNVTRMVHDARYDPGRAEAARGEAPPALAFLEWGLPSTPYSPHDLRVLVEAVASEPGPVLLMSDSLVVYALAGKPSVNPNLWYDPGVSMPGPDDHPRVDRLEALFLEHLERERPELVVFDPPPGQHRFHLEMLPRVAAWLQSRRRATGTIGPFPFWRLAPGGPIAEAPR
jgi:hypothetical protein